MAKPHIIGDPTAGLPEETEADLEDGEEFWHTTVGRFKFAIDSLPQPMQYIHQLLTVRVTPRLPISGNVAIN